MQKRALTNFFPSHSLLCVPLTQLSPNLAYYVSPSPNLVHFPLRKQKSSILSASFGNQRRVGMLFYPRPFQWSLLSFLENNSTNFFSCQLRLIYTSDFSVRFYGKVHFKGVTTTTLRSTTFSTMTRGIKGSFATTSICDTNAGCRCAECPVLFTVLMIVIMLSFVMLCDIMQNVIML